jgi:membrane fusion protein (multidrug efflux system)
MGKSAAKFFFSAAAILAFLGVAYLATQSWNTRATGSASLVQGPAASTVPVELSPITIGRVTEAVHAVGTLEANESIIVRPEIAGMVTNVLFTEGQAVGKGMVLIELDDSEIRAQVAQAESELKIARLTHDRMKQLIGLHNAFISQQQIDQAISSLGTAEANHALYLTRLRKAKIRAPFPGYVGIRRISPGDYVRVGQDLVNLEDIQTLKIDFKVPESFLTRLSVGQRVEVMTDAYPDQTFTGTLYALDPRVDAGSRSARARATVPNADGKLRPGLFVDVHLVLGENDHALLVPEESVIRQRDKIFVYRIQDHTAHLTEVSLGARQRGLVQVLTGLHATDMIVRVGHQKLKDGAPIRESPP